MAQNSAQSRPWDKGGGGGDPVIQRPLDKGGSLKNFFQPFGPKFGLKIRVGGGVGVGPFPRSTTAKAQLGFRSWIFLLVKLNSFCQK